ncbi:zinc finger protein CONSTANS-LIKE 13 [Cornus florida]|uniref:zinc finger protein CONSTANS-LIKE 13 n=1 Tax=Cornus florida TaxID=4283 RepID=UPI002897A08C|nr:zinc finger protein CONSTANS-LIKE 13 [Cornus florida]
MSDSATHPHARLREQRERLVDEDKEQRNVKKTQNRICDFCGESLALLYCRADSAKLCFSCDREVHSTNQLFTKHTRSQLCDLCDSSPASFLCSTENLVLCQNCDWERHGRSSSSLHDRRPLEGFTGCPCVTELLTVLGFEDLGKKALQSGGGDDGLVGSRVYGSFDGNDEFADLLVWDTPSFVSLDDLIVSTNSEHNFQAMGVPPPPKNRNAATGQYKREILNQLRKLTKLEPDFIDGNGDAEPLMGFQSLVPEEDLHPGSMYVDFGHDAVPDAIPSYEACALKWCSDDGELSNKGLHSMLSYSEENYLVPEKDSDIGGCVSHVDGGHEEGLHHHIVTETVQVLPKVTALASQERGTALSRYKEKKKTRRYDKHIRYESRKVRAETRTRIKGRFAKIDH